MWSRGIRLLGAQIAIPRRCLSITSRLPASFKVQDQKDFEERVKNSKIPVIVDFYATWCNPCRMLTPRIETVMSENEGKIILAKVDIDEQTDLALDYNVSSVPVLLLFKNGKPETRMVGLQDQDKLRTFVSKILQQDEAEKSVKAK